jgi:hypothetical protein
MKGFIRNENGKSYFKLQRPLPVNGILSFDNAYLTLGEKSGKKEGPAFVKWLKENHFPGEGWVFYKEEGVLFFSAKETAAAKAEAAESPAKHVKVAPGRGAGKKIAKRNTKIPHGDITAGTIIQSDLPEAKIMITKTNNRGTLKKALALATHFSHKEEHRRLIMRRLEEV